MTQEDKCMKLLDILHDVKHGEYGMEIIATLNKEFPHWREVEWFNGKNAEAYLFKTVLKTRTIKKKKE